MFLVGLFPMNVAEKNHEIQWLFIKGESNDDSSKRTEAEGPFPTDVWI